MVFLSIALVSHCLSHCGVFQKHARECVSYLTSQLSNADNHCLPTLLQEVYTVAEAHPSVLPEFMPTITPYTTNSTVAVRMAVQQIKDLSNKK